jgi:hypothetical protein
MLSNIPNSVEISCEMWATRELLPILQAPLFTVFLMYSSTALDDVEEAQSGLCGYLKQVPQVSAAAGINQFDDSL